MKRPPPGAIHTSGRPLVRCVPRPMLLAASLTVVPVLSVSCSSGSPGDAAVQECGNVTCDPPLVCAPDDACRLPCDASECPQDQLCAGGWCVDKTDEAAEEYLSCETGAIRCAGRATIEVCNVVGPGWRGVATCERIEDCHAAAAAETTSCKAPCEAGTIRCIDLTVEVCDGASKWWKPSETCTHPGQCQAAASRQSASCAAPCDAGEYRCDGPVLQSCDPGSRWWKDVEDCRSALRCEHGKDDGECGWVKPESPGPMVNVGPYAIDATEVTRAQYLKFVLAMGDTPSGSLPECAENLWYSPEFVWPLLDRPDHPVVGVDWCDAYDYCKWAEKRLCGRIGGGANPFEELEGDPHGQWFDACSSGGKYIYPYGDSFAPDACNCMKQMSTDSTAAVGSYAGCSSPDAPYSGIHDLSGNVQEWEDSCQETSFQGSCRLRGGGFFMDMQYLRCDYLDNAPRSMAMESIGFRCCSDP